jgi:hypothetical protein
MDRKVVLHKNDTIYNVLFTQFVERPVGQTPMNIDFDVVEENLDKLDELNDDQYLNMFDEYLTLKFGPRVYPGTAHKPNTKRAEYEAKLTRRKRETRAEYKRFFGSLIKERYDVVKGNADALQAFRAKYGGHCTVNTKGEWIYQFKKERPANVTDQNDPLAQVDALLPVEEIRGTDDSTDSE